MKEKLVEGINGISNVVQALILGLVCGVTSFALVADLSHSFIPLEIVGTLSFMDLYFMPLLSGLASGVFTFFSWLIGKKCSRSVGFNLSLNMSKKELKFNLISGLIMGFFVIGVTELFFLMEFSSGLKLIKEGVYYTIQSGFFEEVWYRLGLMGVFTYSIFNILFRGKEEKKATARKYGAILISILLISVVLQDINMYLTMSRIQMISGLLVKVVPPLFYTWLFYKKGFFHSVTAHITQEILINFILIPLIHVIR